MQTSYFIGIRERLQNSLLFYILINKGKLHKNIKKEKGFSEVEAFYQLYNPQQNLLIGEHGIPIKEFLLTPLEYWIEAAENKVRKMA